MSLSIRGEALLRGSSDPFTNSNHLMASLSLPKKQADDNLSTLLAIHASKNLLSNESWRNWFFSPESWTMIVQARVWHYQLLRHRHVINIRKMLQSRKVPGITRYCAAIMRLASSVGAKGCWPGLLMLYPKKLAVPAAGLPVTWAKPHCSWLIQQTRCSFYPPTQNLILFRLLLVPSNLF